MEFIKYPKTYHIEGSKYEGDKASLSVLPLSCADKNIIIEEKMDGTQVGISFNRNADICLQSRGTVISGETPGFDHFSQWVAIWHDALWDILSDRYIMYGEWLHQKHTIFYDLLPSFFMEYDVFDKETSLFLNTAHRNSLLRDAAFIHSVKVIAQGKFQNSLQLENLAGESFFISPQAKINLVKQANQKGFSIEKVLQETQLDGKMEGLYIKVENNCVLERYKYIRQGFIQHIANTKHWKRHYKINNALNNIHL